MGRFLKPAALAVLGVAGLLGGGYFAVWHRAGSLLREDRRWADAAEGRLREREKDRAPFDWPPYRDYLRALADGKPEFQFEGVPSDDLTALMRWRASGFSLEGWVPSEDVGFDNRHWPFVFGIQDPDSRLSRRLLIETCAAQDLPAGGPLCVGFIRTSWERRLHLLWRGMMRSRELSAAELEECAGVLDRLESARPPLGPSFEAERCLRIRGVLDVYGSGKDPLRMIAGTVDWRSLFSRRILFARILNEVARECADESAAEPLPQSVWVEKGQNAWKQKPAHPLLSVSFRTISWSLYWYEAKAAMARRLLRWALAIAWFEADTGAPPRDLSELVPRYLPKVQPCPVTGTPFHYAGRRVWSEEGGPLASWELGPPRPR